MKIIFFLCASLLIFGLFATPYATTEDQAGEMAIEDTKAFKIGLQATTEI